MPEKTNLDPIAQRVAMLMEEQSITDAEMAQHLGLTSSGISKAFHREGALITHLREIAELLSTTPEAIVSSSTDKSPKAEAPVVEDFHCRPNTLIVRIANESTHSFGRGRYAVLAPPGVAPAMNNLVALHDKEGWRVRRYTVSREGQIILHHKKETVAPELIDKKTAQRLRVVVMLGEKMRYAQ